MAASNLNLGKASGGVLNVQPADGTTTTSLVLPAINGTVVAADSNGNVGIGTSSPISKLSISGYLNSQDSNNNGALYLGQYLNGNGAYGGFEWNNTAGILGLRTQGAYPINFSTNNTERMRIDTAGNVLVTSSGGGLGYGTGAGGTVTQLTSKSTSVTLNKPSGVIFSSNSTLAAGASAIFTFTNNLIKTYDNVIASGNDATTHKVEASSTGNGYCSVKITNTSGVSLSQVVEIAFQVVKGATA